MTEYKDNYCVTDDFYTVNNTYFDYNIVLGSGRSYGVWVNEEPYVVITVYDSSNPFDDAYIFKSKLYIGNHRELIIVDLATLKYTTIACDYYFGYFYEYGNYLFVSTGVRVICFQENGRIKWETKEIAIDGITFVGCDGKILTVSCCMDPYPALWCEKSISLIDGLVL